MGEDLQGAGLYLLRRQRGGEIRVRHGDLRQQMDAFQRTVPALVIFQDGKGRILGAAGKIGGDQHQLGLGACRDAGRVRRRGRQVQLRVLVQRQQCLGGAHGIVAAHAHDNVRLEFAQLRQCAAEVPKGYPLSDGEKLRHPDLLLSEPVCHRRGDPGTVQFRICH